jgi:phosphoribosylglycinamide formyltransferase-1
MKHLCVFASGEGTNTLKIISYFQEKGSAEVALVVTNRADAGVISKVEKLGIKVLVVGRKELYEESGLLNSLQSARIDLIILAGFLWMMPQTLIDAYPGRILNIHPALLPRFGGKGMYGMHVHKAVIEAGEMESGITIHLVNEHYDEGDILFQEKCQIEPDETSFSLASKISTLEHQFFPTFIETFLHKLS